MLWQIQIFCVCCGGGFRIRAVFQKGKPWWNLVPRVQFFLRRRLRILHPWRRKKLFTPMVCTMVVWQSAHTCCRVSMTKTFHVYAEEQGFHYVLLLWWQSRSQSGDVFAVKDLACYKSLWSAAWRKHTTRLCLSKGRDYRSKSGFWAMYLGGSEMQLPGCGQLCSRLFVATRNLYVLSLSCGWCIAVCSTKIFRIHGIS